MGLRVRGGYTVKVLEDIVMKELWVTYMYVAPEVIFKRSGTREQA